MNKFKGGGIMIVTKADYWDYLEKDKKSRGEIRKRPRIFRDQEWRFQILLRKIEYYSNTKQSVLKKIYSLFLKYRYLKLQLKLGIFISINIFDSGLHIVHGGGIRINGKVKIGKNCKLYHGVTIGSTRFVEEGLPVLGDNIVICAGAKIFGDIKIANNIAIGANAVVTKSFEEVGITIAGVPAKKINNKGVVGLIFTDNEQ
jgi:serine O-acetyltransferase